MNIVIFGGSGGLGSQLEFPSHNVIKLSSKDVDILDPEAIKKFFEQTPTDVVINLSGYNSDALIHRIDWEKADRVIDINLKGNLHILKAAMTHMREQRFGRIILISSILAAKPVMGTSVYSATKAAIDNLVKTVAIEGAAKGVTCNSIQLGYFDGGILYNIPEKIREKIRMSIPMKRWGTIKELEDTISWLIGCEYATGISLPLDNGVSLK